MTAEKKRRATRVGLGAVAVDTNDADPHPHPASARGIDCPAPRSGPGRGPAEPLAYRETVAAMPATELGTAANQSGIRPRTRVMERPAEHFDTMPAPPLASKPSLPRDARLVTNASPKRVAATALSSHEAFVLGMIDGTSTVEEIIDASSMPEKDALAIVERLVALGLAAITGTAPPPSTPARRS